jgi:transposase
VVLADKAYSSRAIREHLRKRGIRAVIPVPADQRVHRLRRGSRGGRPPAFDREAYKQRNTVERCINRLKQWRGIATRYEKTATIYLAGLHIAGISLWSARCTFCGRVCSEGGCEPGPAISESYRKIFDAKR